MLIKGRQVDHARRVLEQKEGSSDLPARPSTVRLQSLGVDGRPVQP